MLVEEVPKGANPRVYFSSAVNLSAKSRPYANQEPETAAESASRQGKNRPKVNYNLTYLMNAQTQVADSSAGGSLKSAQQIQLERIISKRLVDLNREPASGAQFELPKNFAYHSAHGGINPDKKARQGNTPTTKKILSARRNLNLYFEEERNVISINSILALNYQFVDAIDGISETDGVKRRKLRKTSTLRPRLRLCCICGQNSSYARCTSCGLFLCSVRCNRVHQELRCN
jgi:zinc finger HIT domain-containing protein 1